MAMGVGGATEIEATAQPQLMAGGTTSRARARVRGMSLGTTIRAT